MALNKQPIAINFARGVDTKTDPYQLAIGSFLELKNSVFSEQGRLTKRYGYQNITQLPDTTQTTLTTLNDNLISTGANLSAFSQDTNQWLNKGIVQPVQLATQPLIRVSTSQSQPDSVITSNGLVCLVYMDNSVSYYQITDSATGQQIVSRQTLPSTAINPRVFVVNTYFIITFVTGGTATLQYIAIPIASPSSPSNATPISATLSSTSAGYDGYVAANNLYLAWGASGTSVKIAYLSGSLAISPIKTISTAAADLMSVTADEANQLVWVTYWDSGSTNGYTTAVSYILGTIVTPTQIITTESIAEITSVAANRVLSVFYENINNYSYMHGANSIRSDYISALTVTAPASGTGSGTVSSTTTILRSVGLASKAFIAPDTGTIYMLVAYGDLNQTAAADNSNQPTYFLIDSVGNIYMRLAYSNGAGYASSQVLPSVSIIDGAYNIPYLVADFLTTVNKGTALPAGTPVNALYTQYGVNMATFTLTTSSQTSSEIAGALHLTGGQLWEYDGVKPVEHGFHVWPENVVVTTATGSGSIAAGTYYYAFTYEWTDNQGNLHRSAPSIPVAITTTTASSTNTIKVPTLRLTYKTSPNPVRIVGYRWGSNQQTYYQFTSVTSPTVNSTTTDSVTFTDALADSAILGQPILYTTGGVVENIAAPASIDSALFNNRVVLIDAEDRNLLWFSKQVIEAVPVEFSDLLTLYIAPTTGAQGSTGFISAISAMDDKLIIAKPDALYYINGSGPDNTGANSSYSDPVFITATVGSSNPDSFVLTPNGLMFQSDKGIWLLGRDLQTKYIGAPVEAYNSQTVVSANTVPGTNQVLFVLDNNLTLMYDYYFEQWSVHTNINAISATLYQGKHTYLNSYGQVFQQTPNTYLDGSSPVLMRVVTGWLNIAGLQGLERFYFANLLGTYYSPFKLNVQFAYNYNPSPGQATIVTPDNNGGTWGSEALWGSGGPWGGSKDGNVFTARVFPEVQKCQSFQVIIDEIFDASYNLPAGAGLSLSGLLLAVGVKKGFRTQSAAKSFG